MTSIRYDKVESLIEHVRRRRPIWEIRSKDHSNRALVNHCWKEISDEMGVDEAVLRKKWKYLRDQFTVEKSKLKTKKSEEAGDSSKDPGWPNSNQEPKWPYYKELLFLKDVVRIRPHSKRLTRQPENSSDEEDDSNDNELKDDLNEIKTENVDSDQITPVIVEMAAPTAILQTNLSNDFDRPPAKRKCFSANNERNEQFLEFNEFGCEKDITLQNLVQPEPENDDMLFFKSLLPYVSKIPFKSKLRFRSRIQDVVEEFAFSD